MMHHVPQAGLTALAVAGPVERGVRPHSAHAGWLLTLEQPLDSQVPSGGLPSLLDGVVTRCQEELLAAQEKRTKASHLK